MSVEIQPKACYSLQLASTGPVHLTGLYATDNGEGKQILLKSDPPMQEEAWFITPVEMEPNTYWINKYYGPFPAPGFMPDANFEKVVLDRPAAKWVFSRVEGPDVPPNVYFIRPVDHPEGVDVGYYLGPNAEKDAAVISKVLVIGPNHLPPAWQLFLLPIDAK